MQHGKVFPTKPGRRWCLWCKTEDTQALLQPCETCQKYGRTSVNPQGGTPEGRTAPHRRQKVASR
jgi:hypothetical protein